MVIDGTRPWFPQFLWFRGKGWGSEEWRWLDGTKTHTKFPLNHIYQRPQLYIAQPFPIYTIVPLTLTYVLAEETADNEGFK